ncbi:MAG: hypothetical protein SNJ57_12745 [Cyanobacteriota bacterium]
MSGADRLQMVGCPEWSIHKFGNLLMPARWATGGDRAGEFILCVE